MVKPIIIDGVDVSGCKNFSCSICEEENKIPRTINHFTADCRMYPNCYFKQLARKTQECEELKNIINEAENSGLDLKSFLLGKAIQKEYEEQIDQLKAANEQAEQKLERIRKYFKNKDISQTSLFNINYIEQDILQIIDEVE